MYGKMVSEGRLVEGCKQTASGKLPLCRTATGRELKMKRREADLYTGTGTIANFVSGQARQVIGIEYVPEAIEDAKVNSEINGIRNTLFFAGDMKDMLTQDFINEYGLSLIHI